MKKREQTVDKIKQKFGNNAIMSGAVMTGELGLYDGSAESDENNPNGHSKS